VSVLAKIIFIPYFSNGNFVILHESLTISGVETLSMVVVDGEERNVWKPCSFSFFVSKISHEETFETDGLHQWTIS